jgi:hypothetical protein
LESPFFLLRFAFGLLFGFAVAERGIHAALLGFLPGLFAGGVIFRSKVIGSVGNDIADAPM